MLGRGAGSGAKDVLYDPGSSTGGAQQNGIFSTTPAVASRKQTRIKLLYVVIVQAWLGMEALAIPSHSCQALQNLPKTPKNTSLQGQYKVFWGGQGS